MTHEITVIPGDGIGQEVVPAAVDVLRATDVAVSFVEAEAGDHVRERTGEPLPAETRATVEGSDATLFGAAGESAADVILELRETVGSYANVRPVRSYPGVDCLRPETDVVFVRENTEGVYAGIESRITDEVSTLTRVVTERASRRIARYGFDYAANHGYESVTIAHKANVMRETDGRFLAAVKSLAAEGDRPYDTALIDALATDLVLSPEDYGVIICPNLAGDVLSDLAAGLVGGLGLLPSANVGTDTALFEPVHGTAPDIAGQGIANPTAAILSGALLLDWLGHPDAGDRIRNGVQQVLAEGPRTSDLGGNASTEQFSNAVCEQL